MPGAKGVGRYLGLFDPIGTRDLGVHAAAPFATIQEAIDTVAVVGPVHLRRDDQHCRRVSYRRGRSEELCRQRRHSPISGATTTPSNFVVDAPAHASPMTVVTGV
jgi:hypothetical protein